jgi:Asp/Glu/hydantoin racemase
MDVNANAYLRSLNAQQVCEAALAAEAAGYDAFAIGCFFDPALEEVRSLVDIPVVSLTESCMFTACSLGRSFAVVSLTPFQQGLTERLAESYGMTRRLAAVVSMNPAVGLFDLEREDEMAENIEAGFQAACQRALRYGAEVIIPGDGVLNEFLVRRNVTTLESAVVMDSLGVLFQHAAFLADSRRRGILDVSHRGAYHKPMPVAVKHLSANARIATREESEFSGPAHERARS